MLATTFRTVIPFAAALLAFAALGSCGDRGTSPGSDAKGNTGADVAQARQLFSDDFKSVCSGASVSTAAAYDPAAPAHKALYFGTYEDDFMDQSTSLPRDWTVQYSSSGDAFRAIDLVVCARRTAARQVKICDGYKKDGKATQNKVRWHTATYKLSVKQARTGATLAETTVEATKTDCPWFMNFDSDSDTVDGYAALSESAVADFLKPHITR